MNCLITGGCGFIGSNLVDELINKKFNVFIIDNRVNNCIFLNKKANYFNINILNYQKFLNAVKSMPQIDCIWHMAAKASVHYALKNPLKILKHNTNTTINSLELCRVLNIKKFIFSSSSSVYGDSSEINKEGDDPKFLNSYAVSKLNEENICHMYNKSYGIKTTCLRYFNVFGERQKFKGKYAPVIGKFLYQKNKNKPLIIYGNGKQIRDFVYVKDVVKANILACFENFQEKNLTFNVGSGTGCEINEIAKLISKNIIYLPKVQGEITNSIADISLIKTNLKWNPSITIQKWILQNV